MHVDFWGCSMSNLQILAQADVVVCGGGTAGVFAAVAAAESGVSVLLLEQQGSLGGTAVGGLVTPMMSTGLQVGLCGSYLSKRIGAKCSFDPIALSITLEALCKRAGVRLCYHVTLCGVTHQDGQIRSATVAAKNGMFQVCGRVFIDCTGDGDLSFFAGANFEKGDPRTGVNQPMSLRYLVSGVNMSRFGSFLDEWGHRSGIPRTAHSGDEKQLIYAAVTNQGAWALSPLFQKALAAGDLTEADCAYWQVFGVPGRPDTLAMNHPEFIDLTDATDPFQLTQAQIQGREAIVRQFRFYQKYFPGFENAYIAQIAPMVGVRESRRFAAAYQLTASDLLQYRKFPDRIAQSNYPVDIHGVELQHVIRPETEKAWYEIPYRCLVVNGFQNLLIAGRCIGADFVAQSAIRIQATCRSLGEAAGIAAAIAVKSGVPVPAVDGALVALTMQERGAEFL